MRVFFDASIIIAALLSSTGGSALLFKYIKAKKITGIISQTVVEEVTEEDKPARIKRSKEEIEQFIAQSGLIVREAITIDEIVPYQGLVDVEDAHLVAGANLTKCEYLVSLDEGNLLSFGNKKHLIRKDIQQKFLPLKIVSPKDLIKDLLPK